MNQSTIPTADALEFDEAIALEQGQPGALRERYWRDGFLLVNGVLSADEAARGREVMDAAITPDSPEDFAHLWGTRRQLKCPENSIPGLGDFACHPNMLALARALVPVDCRLMQEPIAVATFPGNVCGNIADGSWIGHTDGLPTGEVEPKQPGREAPVWMSFRDIEPGGGAMTVVPGSHHWINQAVADAAFVDRKRKDNGYRAGEDLPGLNWNPVELCVKAGGVFIYNGHTIHSASDNKADVPRQVCLYIYGRAEDQQPVDEKFNAEHLKVMSTKLRELMGVSTGG